jgi:hypothetical protein
VRRFDGYKPRDNYQQLLEQVALEYLDRHPDFFPPLLESPLRNGGSTRMTTARRVPDRRRAEVSPPS